MLCRFKPGKDPQPVAESSTAGRPQIRCISVRIQGNLDLDAFNRWVLRTLQDMDDALAFVFSSFLAKACTAFYALNPPQALLQNPQP